MIQLDRCRGRSLAEKVYQCLKSDIVTGSIGPGQLLNENALAEHYMVSRTPVREALKRLSQEGFVNPMDFGGYLVSSVTFKDIKEVYELRILLEGQAAEWAAERISEKDLDRMEQLIEKRADETSADGSDPTVPIRINTEFHMTIARASGNDRMIAAIERLLDENDRILSLDPALRIETTNRYFQDDRSLLAVLRKRDGWAARQAMVNHIIQSNRRIIATLAERGSVGELATPRITASSRDVGLDGKRQPVG